MSLVVVTGAHPADVAEIAEVLAGRLRSTLLSIDGITDELADEAEHTPRDWLRPDAERELLRRLDAFAGRAVLAAVLADEDDAVRLSELLRPWWDGVVEVRCAPPDQAVPALGASRTVVLDGTRPPELGDLVSVVRDETPTVRRVRRG